MLGPVLEQLATKYPEKIEIAKINVDEDDNQELAIMYGVRSIPQVNIFKGGKEVDKFVGALPPEQIEEFIAKHTG
jgi:thioredoxin-like negative regulator of GroEL